MPTDGAERSAAAGLRLAGGDVRVRTASGRSQGLGLGAMPTVVGGSAVSVVLTAGPPPSRRARVLVQGLCQRAGLSSALVEEALVLTSEVVTNALRHGTGDPRLSVVVTRAGVYVEVGDDSRALPPVSAGDAAETGGRGTMILNAWADEWGACVQGAGKVVWFEIHAT